MVPALSIAIAKALSPKGAPPGYVEYSSEATPDWLVSKMAAKMLYTVGAPR